MSQVNRVAVVLGLQISGVVAEELEWWQVGEDRGR